MKFGFQVMLRGAASGGDGLSSIAKSGEDFGFDIIAPNDHLIVPKGIESTYPYTEDEPQTPTYARGAALPLFQLSNGVSL